MNFAWLGQVPGSALLIGDSLAVGLGPPLQRELGVLGISLMTQAEVSTNAAQWRRRAPAILESLRPDVVLMSLGSNDAQSASLSSSFSENVGAICDSARSFGASRCALLVAPNVTAFQVSAPPSVEQIVASSVELQPDGIHPTGAGYQSWAAEIAPVVAAVPVATTVPAARKSSLLPWIVAAGVLLVGIATFPRWRELVGT